MVANIFVKAGVSDNAWGWVWSDNIGWVSFNNCGDPADPATCGAINYGVNIEDVGGAFSGYAWSDNIGWVRFDPNGPYPESPNYSSQVGLTTGNASGWARACAGAVEKAGCAETFSVTSSSGVGIDGNIHTNPMAADNDFLYLVGYDSQPGNEEWRIEKRSKKNGELVSLIQNNPTSGEDVASSAAIDGDYIFIVGFTNGAEWRIEKRDKNTGLLVNSFDGDGVINSRIEPKIGIGQAMEIAVDANSIYVLGSENYISGSAANWRLEKRNKITGDPDTNFNGTGAIVSTFSGYPQALQEDGDYIYIGGYERVGGGPAEWRLEKWSKDGNLQWAKNSAPPDPGTSSYLLDITTDSTYVYSSGRASPQAGGFDPLWRIEKRAKNSGDLVAAFGTNGVVESQASTKADYAVVVESDDNNYLYIVGIEGYSGANKWRIEKRNINNGSLVNDFGTNGVVVVDFPTINEWLVDAFIADDYIYLLGADFTSPYYWRVEKRDIVTGRLNWAGATPYPDPSASAHVYASKPKSGGWDGWIKLSASDGLAGNPYRVHICMRDADPDPLCSEIASPKGGKFNGFGWGDMVLGWVDFEGAFTDSSIFNRPPNKPDTLADEDWEHCSPPALSSPTFTWTFSDPDPPELEEGTYAGYEIWVDNDLNFPSPYFNHVVNNDSLSYTLNLTHDDDSDWLASLDWGSAYYWKVKVKDAEGKWSAFSDPNSFTMPNHAWPGASFSVNTPKPAAKAIVYFQDNSKCYDPEYDCKDNPLNSYFWDFGNGTTSNIAGNATTIYTTSGPKTVTLSVTDDVGICIFSQAVPISAPLPEWWEVFPSNSGFIQKLLALLSFLHF